MNTSFEHKDHWPILKTVEDMYNGDFLVECGLFEGGFINFGYWKKDRFTEPLSTMDRLESSKNLYRYVLNKIQLSKKDNVLEVACGAGMGSYLALSEFDPQTIKGIDSSSSQIARAEKLIEAHNSRISFQIAPAEKIPFNTNFFDKIISIEAAQHFKSLPAFIKEAYRLLKPNGILAIATFFGIQDEPSNEVLEMIPSICDKVDYLHPISRIPMVLQEAGFKEFEIESIGENVWHGFDAWVAQGEFKNSWDRNWYKGYKQGFFDYFMIVAKKH